jgi:hypothetical protein
VIATLYNTLKLSYDEHSTVLSASNPPKASGPVCLGCSCNQNSVYS